jgi:hypothetical protein
MQDNEAKDKAKAEAEAKARQARIMARAEEIMEARFRKEAWLVRCAASWGVRS